MKILIPIIVSLSFISSCSSDKDFSLTEGNALINCGGRSRILENDNEEIVNTKVKDLSDGIGKYAEFTVVETDKKGCLLYTSPSPRDTILSRMPSSA